MIVATVGRLYATSYLYDTVCWLRRAPLAQQQATPDDRRRDSFEGLPVAHIGSIRKISRWKNPTFDRLIPFAGCRFHGAETHDAIEKFLRHRTISGYSDRPRTRVASGAVDVRFITSTSRFFDTSFDGDVLQPPNTGQILSVADIGLGQPFDLAQVSSAEEKIRQLLINNGYFVPVASHSLEYDRQYQQVRVVFKPRVGKRAHYAIPAITGDTCSERAGDRQGHGLALAFCAGLSRHSANRIRSDRIRQFEKSNHLSPPLRSGASRPIARCPPNLRRWVSPISLWNPDPVVEVQATGAGVKVSQKTLRDYLPIYEEGTVDTDLLAEGVTNMRDYFQQRGYFDVKVDFSQQKAQDGKTDIDYAIDLGARHRLVAVVVRGNKYFDNKTIRERMAVVPGSFVVRRGRYSEALAARDKSVMEDLYRSNGFRDVHITTDTQDDYKQVKGDIAVFFTIDEGHQYTVESLVISGAEQLDLAATRDRLSSQEGQPFSEFDVASDRAAILDRYSAAGFADASFSWNWTPGVKPYTVDLKFVIHEGRPGTSGGGRHRSVHYAPVARLQADQQKSRRTIRCRRRQWPKLSGGCTTSAFFPRSTWRFRTRMAMKRARTVPLRLAGSDTLFDHGGFRNRIRPDWRRHAG